MVREGFTVFPLICARLCTKSQIPPALAAWSLSLALGGSFGVTVRYHLLQQRGVSIFRY